MSTRSEGGPRAFAVVDLGFGDAGKGLLTDYLVRRHQAALVVRFNGGAQAGHNVVAPDGTHHTFAQFGAGTFSPGVRTFLSRHVVVHPTALLVEAEALRAKGVRDPLGRIGVSERARVITPFHQAANRLRELARGEARHGSCGVGFGETVQDSLEHPEETVRAAELGDVQVLRRKLTRIRERKAEALRGLVQPLREEDAVRREWALFEHPGVIDAWIEQARMLSTRGAIRPDSTIAEWASGGAVVFEGAQGVLLDEWHGFHPHTTWSTCTSANAEALVGGELPGHQLVRVGVLRSHMVRHGAGPLPTETDDLRGAIRDHNATNDWQGGVRYGWFDAVLARYALEATGGVDLLAVTHLDLPERLGRFRHAAAYAGDVRLEVNHRQDLGHSASLTELLQRVTPVLDEVPADESTVALCIERLVGRPVNLVSRGPRAADVCPLMAV